MKKLLIMNLALIVLFSSTKPAYTQIIYSDNDYGCGWENYASAITRTNSWELGVNLLEYASGGAGSVNMAQIIHNGDWNPDPSALPYLSSEYNSRTGNTMTYSNIDLATADLSAVRLLYITGHYPFSLSVDEKTALKNYLDSGGVLFADDCSNQSDNEGFETSFRNLVFEMYGSSLQVLPSDHTIYSSYYTLDGNDFTHTYPGNGTQWNQEPLEGYTLSITVGIDIKPQSCPNPLNVKSKGVLPVAVLGSEDFDANTVDIASVRLEGVAPIRSNREDVATPVSDGNECDCNIIGPDGFADLVLKFEAQEIVEAIGDVNEGDELPLTLEAVLSDSGAMIEGTDCVVIRGRRRSLRGADMNKDGVVDQRDFALFAGRWLQKALPDDQ
jgi:hypothetical protein